MLWRPGSASRRVRPDRLVPCPRLVAGIAVALRGFLHLRRPASCDQHRCRRGRTSSRRRHRSRRNDGCHRHRPLHHSDPVRGDTAGWRDPVRRDTGKTQADSPARGIFLALDMPGLTCRRREVHSEFRVRARHSDALSTFGRAPEQSPMPPRGCSPHVVARQEGSKLVSDVGAILTASLALYALVHGIPHPGEPEAAGDPGVDARSSSSPPASASWSTSCSAGTGKPSANRASSSGRISRRTPARSCRRSCPARMRRSPGSKARAPAAES